MEQTYTLRKRPRLLMVVNTDWFFLSHRLELARAARDAGAEVIVVAPDTGRGEEIRRQGLGFVSLPLSRSGKKPLQELQTLTFLYRLYRLLRPDLVHHVTIKPILYGSIAARLLGGIAVVNAISGLGFVFTLPERARFLQAVVKRLFRMAMGVERSITLFQNPDDLAFFQNSGLVKKQQTALIRGSGVDCTTFPFVPEPSGPPVVLLATRMLWDKGLAEFVAAARNVQAAAPGTRFVLVGAPDPGNPTTVHEEQLLQWSKEGIIEWWGQRKNMPAVLAQTTLVVLPTYYREGLPKILIEGAATGRPLVATDVPGCREIVRPGINGLLVPPRDAKALAGAILQLLNSPRLRLAFGKASRALALKDFAVEKVVEETLQLYQNLLGERWPIPALPSYVASKRKAA